MKNHKSKYQKKSKDSGISVIEAPEKPIFFKVLNPTSLVEHLKEVKNGLIGESAPSKYNKSHPEENNCLNCYKYKDINKQIKKRYAELIKINSVVQVMYRKNIKKIRSNIVSYIISHFKENNIVINLHELESDILNIIS